MTHRVRDCACRNNRQILTLMLSARRLLHESILSVNFLNNIRCSITKNITTIQPISLQLQLIYRFHFLKTNLVNGMTNLPIERLQTLRSDSLENTPSECAPKLLTCVPLIHLGEFSMFVMIRNPAMHAYFGNVFHTHYLTLLIQRHTYHKN